MEKAPKGEGGRQWKTDLINKLFTKTPAGKLVMATSSPTWQNWYKTQDKNIRYTVCVRRNFTKSFMRTVTGKHTWCD